MSKRAPEETLKALTEWSDEELERLATMSEEELDKELRENGDDPEAIAAEAHAWREKHLGVAPPVAKQGAEVVGDASRSHQAPAGVGGGHVVVLSPRKRRMGTMRWLAAACVVGALAVATKQLMKPAVSPQAEAIALRQSAVRECNSGQYSACIRDIDLARQRDPSGHTGALNLLAERAQEQMMRQIYPPPAPPIMFTAPPPH